MTYRVELDVDSCTGYGSCVQLSPDVFALVDGLARTRVAVTDDPSVLEAADMCPLSAIRVVDAATGAVVAG